MLADEAKSVPVKSASLAPGRSAAFLVLLSLPATAMGLALTVQISALSWFLATRYHLAIEDIALVWAAGPLAGIIGQLLIGALSDRVWIAGGRRRPFILAGGIAAALAMLLLPRLAEVAEVLGLASIMLVAVTVALVLDLAVNVGFNPARSLIADVTREGAERTRAFSIMQLVSGSFGVGAYALAALLGNDALVVAAAALVLLFTLIPVLTVAEPASLAGLEPVPQAEARLSLRLIAHSIMPLWPLLAYNLYGFGLHTAGIAPAGFLPELVCALAGLGLGLRELTRPPTADSLFRRTLAASALCWLGVQPIFVFMVSFLQQRMPELTTEALGQTTSLAFLALNAVAAIAPLALGPLAQWSGAVQVHVAALCLMALGCLGLALFAHAPWQLFLLMAICGIGWGSVVSLPFAIMSQAVAPQRMGLFMGIFNLSVVLPQLVSSLGIARFVASAGDKGMVFALSAGFLALSALCWARLPSFVTQHELGA
jgi:MFS family permease